MGMWQGNFNIEARMESLLVVLNLKGGTQEAQAAFRGQPLIGRMIGQQSTPDGC
jgi:hypothetical protein